MTLVLTEIRTGGVRSRVSADGRTWRSAIAKTPVQGAVHLARLGLSGDAVGNRKLHGGPDQAVLAYAAAHYASWAAEGFPFTAGCFGENFLIAGLTDQDVCIGDRYALGGAEVQVSQPRQPCETLARHLERPEVVARVYATGRGGWYLRVLQEGPVEAGMELRLLERPNPGATVAKVLEARFRLAEDPAAARALAGLSGLSQHWADRLGGA